MSIPLNIKLLSHLIAQNQIQSKRVFIRADLNVPQDQFGQITEDTRIKASVPAIQMCLAQGAAVMVTSHLGRPRDDALAKKMASLCDVYVNDAFGTAHRAEATTHGMARYAPIACAGPLMEAELDALTKALSDPKRPLVAIVAGSKVSTKLSILRSLASKVDLLIVGGGIANTFMLASGLAIGKSLAEPSLVAEAQTIMQIMHNRGASVPIPEDVVVANELSPMARANIADANSVAEDDMILDIGPKTAAKLATIISSAGTIVWNGPVGVFEIEQFGAGTKKLANAIAQSPGFSIAGGGDTLAAIAKYEIEKQIGYISTGGGAFLEFLEGKTLPAIAVLQERA